jgi:Zn-dependent membrane protease YugP
MSWQGTASFAFLWIYHMTQPFLALTPGLIVAAWAQSRLRKAFREGSTPGGMTGEQMAERVLREAHIEGVTVVRASGPLATFYDWQRGQLRLAATVFEGNTVGLMAAAAQEAGHVLQPLWLLVVRTLMTFALRLGVIGAWLIVASGMLMDIGFVALIGGVLYSALVLFALIVSLVEHDANRRVRPVIVGVDLGGEEKARAFDGVLAAVAYSHVAAMWPMFGRGA